MTAYSDTRTRESGPANPNRIVPELVLCATDQPLATAWASVTDAMGPHVHTYRGSILEVSADAVVSPANSHGWMRGDLDAGYARAFPELEQRVRSAVLAYHGGEVPIGEALAVPTCVVRPRWLISAPTVREPGDLLPADTVHPYLAARAVFLLWRDDTLEQNGPARTTIETIAMPGLGTGVGGLAPEICAHQVAAAWGEVFGSP